jgi:hypothetical protein
VAPIVAITLGALGTWVAHLGKFFSRVELFWVSSKFGSGQSFNFFGRQTGNSISFNHWWIIVLSLLLFDYSFAFIFVLLTTIFVALILG